MRCAFIINLGESLLSLPTVHSPQLRVRHVRGDISHAQSKRFEPLGILSAVVLAIDNSLFEVAGANKLLARYAENVTMQMIMQVDF